MHGGADFAELFPAFNQPVEFGLHMIKVALVHTAGGGVTKWSQEIVYFGSPADANDRHMQYRCKDQQVQPAADHQVQLSRNGENFAGGMSSSDYDRMISVFHARTQTFHHRRIGGMVHGQKNDAVIGGGQAV